MKAGGGKKTETLGAAAARKVGLMVERPSTKHQASLAEG